MHAVIIALKLEIVLCLYIGKLYRGGMSRRVLVDVASFFIIPLPSVKLNEFL